MFFYEQFEACKSQHFLSERIKKSEKVVNFEIRVVGLGVWLRMNTFTSERFALTPEMKKTKGER